MTSQFDIARALERIATEIKDIRDILEEPKKKLEQKKETNDKYRRAYAAGYMSELEIDMRINLLKQQMSIDAWLSQPFYVRWFDDKIEKCGVEFLRLKRMTADERITYLVNQNELLLKDIFASNQVARAEGLPVFIEFKRGTRE